MQPAEKSSKLQHIKKAIKKVKPDTGLTSSSHKVVDTSSLIIDEKPVPAHVAPAHVAEEEQKSKLSIYTPRYKSTTLSIAVPASIVLNSQSPELQTYLVGQIARSASVFRIDEIVVINDCESSSDKSKMKGKQRDVINFFVKNLEYLETPQYLRKALFPVMPELQYTGLMNPLDAPHHLRQDEPSPYREGVVIDRPVREGKGSWVNIGLRKDCQINVRLEVGTRITVKLDDSYTDPSIKFYNGTVVSQLEPKQVLGKYWGYTVRISDSLSDALYSCPFAGKSYDLLIGTSDKGERYDAVEFKEVSTYNHAMIMFGGLPGIEGMIEGDDKIKISPTQAATLFKYYVNTCPDQGCRTIRTEEAIIISLAVLVPKLGR